MSMQLRGPKPFAVVLCEFDDLPAPDVSRNTFWTSLPGQVRVGSTISGVTAQWVR